MIAPHALVLDAGKLVTDSTNYFGKVEGLKVIELRKDEYACTNRMPPNSFGGGKVGAGFGLYILFKKITFRMKSKIT